MSDPERTYIGRVIATAAIYIAAAWAAVEALLTMVDRFGLQPWWGTLITAVFVAGLPVVLYMVWRTAGADRHASAASIAGSAIFLVVATAAIFLFTRPEPPMPAKAVAIVPCDYQGESEYAYRAEGLAEDVHARLSRVDAVKILSWNSSLFVHERGYTPRQIADVLHVDRIVLCRMRATSDRMNLTASVIDPAGDAVLWDREYDFTADSLGTVVTELAGTLLDVLNTPAQAAEIERMNDVGTFSPRAYDLVLEASVTGEMKQAGGVTLGDLDRVAALYRQALEIDPNYAKAMARLAGLYLDRAMAQEFDEATEPYDWIVEARSLSQRALELDPGVYQARRNLATVCGLLGGYYGEPCPQGEGDRLLAEECEVRGDTAEGWGCRHLLAAIRNEDESEELERWLELEPTSWNGNMQKIGAEWAGDGRPDLALARFDTLRALYPEDNRTFGLISNLLRSEGRFDEVLAWRYASFNDELPIGAWRLARLGTDYMNLGLYERARDIGLLTWETRRASATHFLPRLWVKLGEPNRAREAMEWLAATLEEMSGSNADRVILAAFYASPLRDYERARQVYAKVLADKELGEACDSDACVVQNALVLVHINRELGEIQEADRWLQIAERAAGDETELIHLRIAQGRYDEAVRMLRERVFAWHTDGEEFTLPMLVLEQDALLDPLREMPEFQSLMSDYEAHLEPQREHVLQAEADGDWESLRQRVYERVSTQ